jgi:photosystem II stability/assembly factor-like uncharacterized protein
MFGHLDDPATIAPGDRDLERVLLRAGQLRRRTRLTSLAIFCLVIAGATGFLVGRPSHVRVPSSETGYQFNALKDPLSVGTPVPTTSLLNVVFDNAQVGFALAAHRGQAVLAATTDGGRTWQVRNDQLPRGYGQNAGFPGQFEFVGSDGYLWGGAPAADGAAPLWVTTDSGVSWHEAAVGPMVYDVSAIGENVWALTSGCPRPLGATTQTVCPLVVEQSPDGGTRWSATTTGLSTLTDGPLAAQRVELARITLNRAYVLITVPDEPAGGLALIYTGDGGQDWVTRPVPCAASFGLGDEMAASGTDDLWLLCGSQAAAGSQSKELYRSSDAGSSWLLSATASASTTGLGTTAVADPAPSTLPLGGYIAPFSIGHKTLAVLSPTTAWLYLTTGSLLKTVSGGRTWTAVPDLVAAGFGTGAPGNVTFISATQGWICAYGVGLWHTTDGEHWAPLGVS